MDWIVPLIVVGVTIYRAWAKNQQRQQQRERRTSEPEWQGEAVEGKPIDEWNDLLEALGHKPSTETTSTTVIIRSSTPPPPPPPPAPLLEKMAEEEEFDGMPKRHLESRQGPSWDESTAFEKFDKRETFAELRANDDRQAKLKEFKEQKSLRLEQERQSSLIQSHSYSYNQEPTESEKVLRSSYRFDRQSLRRAFVLKEILDPPIAMR